MGKAMERNWQECSSASPELSKIPSILINDGSTVDDGYSLREDEGIDWDSVAERVSSHNYAALKENYDKNPEFLITNLLFQTFRFFPDFMRAREEISKFEEKRTIELDEKLQDINQRVLITDSYVASLNQNVGFIKDDGTVESLSCIKYSVTIDNIEARRMEGFSNIKNLPCDEDNMVVCINHGTGINLGYCNVISTRNLKERSYSIQTFQSGHTEDDEDEIDISINTETEAHNISLNNCFKQVQSRSLEDSAWNLSDLNREWCLSPKIFRHQYISKSLNATLLRFDGGGGGYSFQERAGVIYCSSGDGQQRVLESFTPVINVPYDLTEELHAWERRASKVITTPQTGSKYQWPPLEVKDFASTMSFHLTPFPRKDNRHIEWRIELSELFDRLLKSLSQNQLRAYLFAIAIYKTYEKELRPLKETHFKHIIFHLVEKNPAGPLWFDENLGKTVFHIYETLKKYLQERVFPHYFMPKWNLLVNFSPGVINSISSRVHLIIEDYLISSLESMSRLHYVSEAYPKVNLLTIQSALKNGKILSKKSRGGGDVKSKLKQVLPLILKEFFRLTLDLLNKCHTSDPGFYSSLMYTLDNLVSLVKETSLDESFPEIHALQMRIRNIKRRLSRPSPYELWYHDLANENVLLVE